jgi:hypothetical protein
MNIDQVKESLQSRIWQSIASSGVNVSALPEADLQKLVDRIARDVLGEVDALLEKASDGNAIPEVSGGGEVTADGEQVLWEGRPFLSLVEHYRVTTERVRILTGLLGRNHEDIELARVKDVDWKQGLSERMLGIGDILLNTADATRPQAVLRNVKHPEQVHEIIRRAVLEVRKKYHIIFEQEL